MQPQTAVEWLIQFVTSKPIITIDEWHEAFKHAKAMEKEQIINAYSQGLFGEESNPPISAYSEQYYNETYNNKNKIKYDNVQMDYFANERVPNNS
jgi:hypothetical protein